MTGDRTMRRLTGNNLGMTLVEILIAIGIIGVGLAALASVIPVSSYGIQEGNQLSTSTFLANQRLEQVRNGRWSLNGSSMPFIARPGRPMNGRLRARNTSAFGR